MDICTDVLALVVFLLALIWCFPMIDDDVIRYNVVIRTCFEWVILAVGRAVLQAMFTFQSQD